MIVRSVLSNGNLFFSLASYLKWEHSCRCSIQGPTQCDSYPLHQQGTQWIFTQLSRNQFETVRLIRLPFFYTCRERKMPGKSERLNTTASVAASPCSITLTMASCCTPSTCSRWWHCSSPTWPQTLNSVWSAKCTATTSITARKIASKDALMSSSRSTIYDCHHSSSTLSPKSHRHPRPVPSLFFVVVVVVCSWILNIEMIGGKSGRGLGFSGYVNHN